MSAPTKAALEGTIHTPDFERWAAGMVESTTEYDFGEIPTVLQKRLLLWCADFAKWTTVGTPFRGSTATEQGQRGPVGASAVGGDVPGVPGGSQDDEWRNE